MRNKQQKPFLALCIFCLGLSIIAAAQDDGTYSAYPGAPTQVPTPVSTPTITQANVPVQAQETMPSAYITQPTAISTPSTAQTAAIVTTPVTTPVTAPITTAVTASSSGVATAMYYAQAPPVTQQNVLLTYDIQTAPPAAVYYSGSYLPWTSFYQVFSSNAPALWISSSLGWSWYATSPAGNWVQELMYVPVTGNMKVYDLYPDGTTRYFNYGFVTPGYKYRWFRADTPGRYMTMVTIADIPSNYIIVDAA